MYPSKYDGNIGVCLHLTKEQHTELKAAFNARPRIPLMLRAPTDPLVLEALSEAQAKRERKAKA